MKADLHCHSHFSDGKHPASFLIERALANGVTHLAITDHDCTDAHVNFDTVEGLSIIKGVEISCTWQNHELHIVGLCIDIRNAALVRLLSQQQQRRQERILKIHDRLINLGIQGLLNYMSELPAIAQTRSHVVDFLVQQQAGGTRENVFKKYLAKKGKAYVAADWCTPEEAIAAITSAGGVAVLAHPGRYGMNRSKLSSLVDAFKEAGGDALECSYPNISSEMQMHLLDLATSQRMYVSAGSDFHDATATWTDVGRFLPLPESHHPSGVWHHPAWLLPRSNISAGAG